MAISLLDNFDYGGQEPNFTRDLHSTIADMAVFSEDYLPNVFVAMNEEDGGLYIFNRSNSVDEITGKWRKFEGGSADLSEYLKKTAIEELISENSETDQKYTDDQIALMKVSEAIVCDELPTYSEGTITYIKDGETKTTTNLNTWFFYADGIILYQTIFVEGEELTIQSGGGVDFSEYVKKEDGASGITYERTGYPLITNVKQAIDKIFDKMDYVAPEISSFTVTPATTVYEIGAEVTDLTFNWTYNKDVVSQSLTDCTVEVDDRTASWSGNLTTNKTFTLSASDSEKDVSKSIAIAFRNKIYWGSKAIPTDYDSDFILGLSGSNFATNYKGSYSMTVASGEYGFLAFPSSFGVLSSVFIGGFETTVESCGEISFTNASGGTVAYSIYRTGRSGLGAITMEIK